MKIDIIYKQIKSHCTIKPAVCIILGSGLNSFTNLIKNQTKISYKAIDGFIQTTVKGHDGEFIFGYINNTPILCAKGRFHYYEGHEFDIVSSIIDIFNCYSPKLLIITNSSGCVNKKWKIGNFMIANKFLDFSFIKYSKPKTHLIKNNKYYNKVLNISKNNKIITYEGTYTYTIGPSYETPKEIEKIIKCGGDAVGMSTFPEFLKCEKLSLETIFISCLTNYGAGIKNEIISHEDVLKNAKKSRDKFSNLIYKIIENIGTQKIQKK